MSASFPVVIHHNPECGTSRNVLAIIEAAGYAPVVIDYLRERCSRPQASQHDKHCVRPSRRPPNWACWPMALRKASCSRR
jgi:hypothetical protein